MKALDVILFETNEGPPIFRICAEINTHLQNYVQNNTETIPHLCKKEERVLLQ
jgi:hypothetical protein